MSLTVENMSFGYGKHPVLHELTFTAEAGELLAILGPNGVGKTTLFKCVMGQERKYSGRIAADGADLAAVPGEKERAAARDAMARVNIEHLAERPFDHLSGGEQQLVFIARALAQQAKILLMDEPTASLDYGNRLHVLGVVRDLSRAGYTILLSTHDPQHALWYADRALALKAGRMLALGTPRKIVTADLLQQLYGRRIDLVETQQGPVLVPKEAD